MLNAFGLIAGQADLVARPSQRLQARDCVGVKIRSLEVRGIAGL
jgi:hypothetical protein